MHGVHAAAVVDGSAVLADDVTIGAHAVVEAGVEIGAGTVVLPGTVLMTGTRIGARCRIGPYAVIGNVPMDHAFGGEESFVHVGDDVKIWSFSSVHRATGAGAVTSIGDGTWIMTHVHVAHNATLEDGVVVTSSTHIGGHVHVGRGATLGGDTKVHQFVRIGSLAMVAGRAGVTRDVLPFSLAQGYPARHLRLNRVGLQRAGIVGERYAVLERAVRHVRRRQEEAFEELADEHPLVAELRTFLRASRRGMAGFAGRPGKN